MGHDLEISVRAKLEGHIKAAAWEKEKIQTLYEVHNDQLKKMWRNIALNRRYGRKYSRMDQVKFMEDSL